MVTLRNRSETVAHTETVQLHALFKDSNGQPVDLDAFPYITITAPNGNINLGPTSAGVYKLSTGLYGFDYAIGLVAPIGVYNDSWQGTLNGMPVFGNFQFVVFDTQLPAVNSDGYEHLGDSVGFSYSPVAIHNINKLLKTLKARLNSAGKKPSVDQYGNQTYVDCDIFSVDMLVTFLGAALAEFNEIGYMTFFTFDDTAMIDQFHFVIVQGATIQALASIALIERGREFNITDSGVSFSPPTVSELLNTQYSAELGNYWERIKHIKNNLRPSPSGLGGLTISSARNTYISRLRHRRQNQIF